MKCAIYILMAAVLAISTVALAKNYPCSKKKGGVSHCQGTLFICKDGSASQSKQNCKTYKR
jgi:hypothetical protein